MRMSLMCVWIAALAIGNAWAQDCVNPLPLSMEGPLFESGDLCEAANTLPGYGVTPSPQAEVVYSFVDNGYPTSFSIEQGSEASWGGQSAAIFLMPSPCSSSTDPIALGAPGTPMLPTNLINGATYYVIVTADPASAASTCGTYLLRPVRIPVELQSFTID